MNNELEVATELRGLGERVTPQRLRVLSFLKNQGGHLTATEIASATSAGPGGPLDNSTVYRALALAEHIGLVARFEQPGADAQFEWIRDQHHHLICDKCGHLSTLDDSVLNKFVADVLDARGFSINMLHLAIRGRCSRCSG